MPNRILKESIKENDQIDSLSWFEEVLYYRMIVSADDYGCIDGRPVLLKNELFPLKENVTKKSIEDAVNKLVKAGLLYRYTANGKPYLFFPTWEKHQRVRNKRRKYPNPFDCGLTDNCLTIDGQMTADCALESESNPIRIQSESESESNVRTSDDFARFWSAYPKKVGKKDAEKAYRSVNEPVDVLIEAVERQKQSKQWREENGRFIPNPATWLRQGRWMDEDYAPTRNYDEGEDFCGW